MNAKALIVAAPGSGHGKTLVCAGLARALIEQGAQVTVFKMGPDYLDPQFLEKATGLQVRQLDYWMLGHAGIERELSRAASRSEFVIIEGVMGLFDGSFPVAQLAREYALPVTLVIDASAMAQTLGAVVAGLAGYDPGVRVSGVLANCVGSEGHGAMIAPAVREPVNYLGWVQRDEALQVQSRHLGISATAEQARACADHVAQALQATLPLLTWHELPKTSATASSSQMTKRLTGWRIAVARDRAFNFLYHANLDFLTEQGAVLEYFSPVGDNDLPDCDALYLAGGYPELALDQLARNAGMLEAIRAHVRADKPCVAECGGMLYLLESLTFEGNERAMLGLIPGRAELGRKLAAIGYQSLPGTSLRGHTFHYARVHAWQTEQRAAYPDGREGELLWQQGALRASFVHWYFDSDPATVCDWFKGKG